MLLTASFQIHVYDAAYYDDRQHNEAASAFTFILAHEPDKESYQRQHENGKENDRWNAHYY